MHTLRSVPACLAYLPSSAVAPTWANKLYVDTFMPNYPTLASSYSTKNTKAPAGNQRDRRRVCGWLPWELVTKFSTTSNQFTPQLVSLPLQAATPSCFCLCKFVSNNKTTLIHTRATEQCSAHSPSLDRLMNTGMRCSSAGTIPERVCRTSVSPHTYILYARSTRALIWGDLLDGFPYNDSVCLLFKPTAVKYKELLPPTGQNGYNS